jgi:hypothetical protein
MRDAWKADERAEQIREHARQEWSEVSPYQSYYDFCAEQAERIQLARRRRTEWLAFTLAIPTGRTPEMFAEYRET